MRADVIRTQLLSIVHSEPLMLYLIVLNSFIFHIYHLLNSFAFSTFSGDFVIFASVSLYVWRARVFVGVRVCLHFNERMRECVSACDCIAFFILDYNFMLQ